MTRHKKDENRKEIKTCKACGKTFQEDLHKKICNTCWKEHLTKAKIKTPEKIEEELKERWEQKLAIMEELKTKEPEWDENLMVPRTTTKCEFCNDYHWRDKTYFHKFKEIKLTIGLPINNLLWLIHEYEESKENPTKFLEKRGLIKWIEGNKDDTHF